MSVPDGFFDDFAARMEAILPERPEIENEQAPVPPSGLWQRVRPYVYMAAMFAGIWLMLQMFSMMRSTSDSNFIDNNPVLAQALESDDFVYDYIYSDMSSEELLDDIIEDFEQRPDFVFENEFNDPADDAADYVLPK